MLCESSRVAICGKWILGFDSLTESKYAINCRHMTQDWRPKLVVQCIVRGE
jgi:hypothetical protein